MSQMGQERRIGAGRNISAFPPRADVGADIVEPPVGANGAVIASIRRTGITEYLALGGFGVTPS